LGEEGLAHSLNEPGAIGLFTNADLLPTVCKVIRNTPSVKFILYDGEGASATLDELKGIRDDLQVLTLDQVCEKGKNVSDDALKARLPTPDTVACIMYTSGSTGAPKGVILKQSNLVASIGAIYVLLGHHFKPTDTFLAYLPLAHILEFIVELCLLFVGCTVGYGRVKTLTDASVRKCQGDLPAFKPTIMVGVPAVWETIRKGIIAKVNAGGALKKRVFNGALTLKRANVPVLAGLADTVVLSAVRAATGGKLRLALSGGAALSRETQEFLTTALVTMLQGESWSVSSIMSNNELRHEATE
jgi:long-chain acyl-CoA synthetase